MAASVGLVTGFRFLCRRLRLPKQEIRCAHASRSSGKCGTLLVAGIGQGAWGAAARLHTGSVFCSLPPAITVTDEADVLYRKVEVLVKGHDKAVLDSYEFFTTMAAQELGVTIGQVYEPKKKIERLTVLKSVHIHKKHRVQYEMRTHYKCIEFLRLTGSTAEVFLEYIQRNLPEGVAMEVTKTAIEKIPDHILEPLWNSTPQKEQSSQ
ncbi:probable 28S ribosomal protein S10, mitochondrial [Brienomyrus brachyistius]|uniref:probable 28S ribosomal protein S10, mitochondrial n=1 Tax=Brienomyrus brachyistius TaxID=42636 RepID=UPI0020B21297|nr:probable 28S ribosomal protein S10, mitochondrial [Brienomyrus brachyistius]